MDKELGLKFIKIGLNISYYRKLKGVTQETLAEKVGISKNYISRLEAPNLYVKPSLVTLFKIADYLEINASQLLHFKDEK